MASVTDIQFPSSLVALMLHPISPNMLAYAEKFVDSLVDFPDSPPCASKGNIVSSTEINPGEQIPCTWSPRDLPSLSEFIEGVVLGVGVGTQTFFSALVYLDRIRKTITELLPFPPHHLFLATLALASKELDDPLSIYLDVTDCAFGLFARRDIWGFQDDVLPYIGHELDISKDEYVKSLSPFLSTRSTRPAPPYHSSSTDSMSSAATSYVPSILSNPSIASSVTSLNESIPDPVDAPDAPLTNFRIPRTQRVYFDFVNGHRIAPPGLTSYPSIPPGFADGFDDEDLDLGPRFYRREIARSQFTGKEIYIYFEITQQQYELAVNGSTSDAMDTPDVLSSVSRVPKLGRVYFDKNDHGPIISIPVVTSYPSIPSDSVGGFDAEDPDRLALKPRPHRQEIACSRPINQESPILHEVNQQKPESASRCRSLHSGVDKQHRDGPRKLRKNRPAGHIRVPATSSSTRSPINSWIPKFVRRAIGHFNST